MDQLFFVVHTHWDREWYQPFQQMRARLVAMADRMIPLVERGAIPSFHFDGQTIALDDYLELRPEAEARLKKLVGANKIQVGPWYVLADSFLVSGESLIRNLEIGMATAKRFGHSLEVGYLPDQFGHIAQMPQILAGFGFTTAVLWRGVGADVNRNRFIWEAPDGSSLLTIYLPNGYSNGANLPLESLDRFLARAEEIARREREFAAGTPILVMNGTDHAEPDARLATRINEAREVSAMTFELGDLETYARRVVASAPNGTPHHRGELRSPLRSHLLPGVTSARTWIKQRDFENCRALERYADPIAAIANALGRGEGLEAFLELAWRTEIQNHPHDSICGCSVDQVHTDMRFRFDQAAMVAEDATRRASAACLKSAATDASMIAVFNPSFSRAGLVSGEIEVPDAGARHAIETADGRRIATAVDTARTGRSFDADMAASEFKSIVSGISQPAVFGRTVNRYEIGALADGRPQVNLFMSRAAFSELDLEEFRHAIRARIPDSGAVRIHATMASRSTISFVTDDLAQTGFSFYRLVRDEAPAIDATPESVPESIENEYCRVTANPRGLEIRDLRRNASMELYFEDEGDRGDEYNYDPVLGAERIATPASISSRIVERGPVRSRITMSLMYDIPASLTGDRATRSNELEKLEIELVATIHAGLERIDLTAEVQNRARDHRLRLALRTAIATAEAVHDTSFGVVRRPLDRSEQPGTEDIYPTVPHRTFTAVEGRDFSTAMIARGLYEAEVRPDAGGSTILLTLLRCVGWLSRSDLATRRGGAGPELETPDAQEPGAHRFDFSVATFERGYLDGDLLARIENFTAAPRMFAGRGGSAGRELALVGCDNPRVMFSTARPLKSAGRYKVRVFSASSNPERARFSFCDSRRVRQIDLAGRAIPSRAGGLKRSRDGSVTLELKPFEIVTFEVRERRH